MKSKYVGVSWCKKAKKWQVSWWNGTHNEHVGMFKDEKKARKAYQKILNR